MSGMEWRLPDAAQGSGTVCLRPMVVTGLFKTDGCHRAPIAGLRLTGSENWAAQLIMLNRP